ncbi:serine/threonine-protein kinase [Chitinibacter tainanensis]|uniref:serine/threonine-protein kinase n=1 Tax=Chitinibacter tainanensis TaxID=230667 RepID=UPI000422554D|nr:serine/threonine-protein kinase [Chitinibacter tainanensis]
MSSPQIAHYTLQHRLGAGAMGVVFKARDTRLERDVALKLLQVNLASSEAAEYAARLLQEARSAARLNHPGIITVFDCGEWRGKNYLAMELVEGATLKDLLARQGPLPVRDVVGIARQLFAALAHAHIHQIIHRDIKPANLMLTRAGRLKITDFGIAQLPASELTRTGTVLGSPRYMPAEQLAGQPLDGRADLYAAGVVLYQALTGALPFDGETTMNIVYQVLHHQPPAPAVLRPEVPEWLSALVMRCMARQREARFADAAAALAALQAGWQSGTVAQPASATAAHHHQTTASQPDTSSHHPHQAHTATVEPNSRASAQPGAVPAGDDPLRPWLASSGRLLHWLARHGWRGTRQLLAISAAQLRRWTPVLARQTQQQWQRWQPVLSRIAQQGWQRYRRWPWPLQLGLAIGLLLLLAWWGRPAPQIEWSQPPG